MNKDNDVFIDETVVIKAMKLLRAKDTHGIKKVEKLL